MGISNQMLTLDVDFLGGIQFRADLKLWYFGARRGRPAVKFPNRPSFTAAGLIKFTFAEIKRLKLFREIDDFLLWKKWSYQKQFNKI